ncbi:hypothetical protein HELRODRAFT_160946 [Helobdella robusta]|uniref:Pleckstrin homology domain-containing protein n=1 Tax=Helobdella robusta TaxID=6412 RepID=T1EQW5_HELRO|nr:hypothetical protein HELRODRAFT_160946 [Helobdella robusta]ESO01784.1 hypothetical protein HELRODRAFT_160946 [Helobdella robusta]
MEVTQPLINLLDNMLTMGSLYNGDSLMYASQYKTNQLKPEEVVPAKPMLEFNRIRQERSLLRSSRRSSPSPPSRRSNNQNNPRSNNDADDGAGDDDDVSAEVIVGRLEVQLNELHRLDGLMHAQSTIVSDLLQDKVLLEKSLHEVDKQQKLLSSAADDDVRLAYLNSQKTSLQDDVARVVLQIQQQQQVLNKTRSDLDTCERAIIQLRNKWQLINKDINAPHDTGEHRFVIFNCFNQDVGVVTPERAKELSKF